VSAVARMVALDLRTVAPCRNQGLMVFVLDVIVFAYKPATLLPALVLLFTATVAAHPFSVADKSGLDTLYAVLPLSRRCVLYGRYTWALASFLVTAIVGTALTVLFARVQSVPLDARTLGTVLTLSWALFAVNVAIQFPLLFRFGYTRASVLGTSLSLALVIGTVYRMRLTVASVQDWLPVFWVAGAVTIVASVAVAMAVDQQRVRAVPR
jgi:ABC-2 family transporter protein